ncbi:hypothetical protein GCM10009844_24220 [Nocardioides koreensis]|uniref:Uncharacterized protein n=1 Tax=Nocardioides koreensis TaxID=433651 RepID=A0ABP5LK99_9ACTN
MTVDETYDELRRAPFWQVQAVFDPDGEGGDFAYTIGLRERGLPELHLWARPTLGEDPGHDWGRSTWGPGGAGGVRHRSGRGGPAGAVVAAPASGGCSDGCADPRAPAIRAGGRGFNWLLQRVSR